MSYLSQICTCLGAFTLKIILPISNKLLVLTFQGKTTIIYIN